MASPTPLEALLETLRISPAQVARNPRAAIEAAIAQLRRVKLPDSHAPARGTERVGGMAEYRIDDLARAADMTTRNVRAYQDRGLLHAPRRAGRVAIYDDSHLARLKLIGSMLGRGYTAAHISEMLTAWEHGKELGDVLGVEEELIRPRGEDQPRTMSIKDARALAGDRESFERLSALGLIRVQGSKAQVTRPMLLEAYAELHALGMPMQRLIDLQERIQAPLDDVARQLVLAAVAHFATVKGPTWVPDADELVDLTQQLARFRELAMSSTIGTLAASMEKSIESVLGSYLAQLAQPDQDVSNADSQQHTG